MKRNLIALLALALAAPAFATTATLSPESSKISWLGKKVTGQHNGAIKLKSGKVELEGSEVKSGTIEVDMTSISNEDLKDAGYNAKLVGHLKSEDFFGTEKFPVATFAIKSVKKLAKPAADGADHEVAGDLTIKGTTQAISFPAHIVVKGGAATARATVKIDRTKFNIKYRSGKFFEGLGDKMIHDEFELNFDLSTKI